MRSPRESLAPFVGRVPSPHTSLRTTRRGTAGPLLITMSLVAVIAWHPGTARADEVHAKRTSNDDAREATALFYAARHLMARGAYGEACPKLERSLDLDPGIGTRFNLANCYEHVGKLASAWTGFEEVARLAAEAGQAERERIARERAQALEARLPQLLVVTTTLADASAEVRRDGILVPRTAWGTPFPVDPGAHTITVTAVDREPWETTVQAAEGKTTSVTVPRLLVSREAAFRAPPPQAMSAGPTPAGGSEGDLARAGSTQTSVTETTQATVPFTFPPPVVESRGGAQRTVGFVVTALGVATLGVAGGFGLHSLSKHDAARDHCVGNMCDATGVALRRDARNAGNVSTITAIAGGAAVVTGVILALTAPSKSAPVPLGRSSEHKRTVAIARPNIVVGPHGGMLTVEGVLP